MTDALETLASIQVTTGTPEPRPQPERVSLTPYGQLLSHVARLEARIEALERQLADMAGDGK